MSDPRARLTLLLQRALPVLDEYAEAKTLAQYLRQLGQYARDYMREKLDDTGFLNRMISSISEQINRAWNEGMRANGLDPDKDKTQAQKDRIAELVKNEEDHITNLADLINAQRAKDPEDFTAINARVEVWANRYTEVVNIAKVETGKDNLFEWVYGDTVHCETCAALNGTVLTADEWAAGDYHPQAPPNDKLECGGWRCKCKLVKTKKPRTGLPAGM